MLIAFPVLIVLAALLCIPPFLYSRKRGQTTYWLLFLSFPSIVTWVALAAKGVGAQNLENLADETFILLGGGIVLAWLKAFVIDPRYKRPKHTTYGIILLLATAAILLRLFMPELPE